MQRFQFGFLNFEVNEGKISLVGHGNCITSPYGFTAVQLNGENKPTSRGIKTVYNSGDKNLTYVSHEITGDTLTVTQKTDKVQIVTVFEKRADANALRIHTEITNISAEEIILEEVSAFIMKGLLGKTIDDAKTLRFTRFLQSHHAEALAREYSFFDLGLHRSTDNSQRKIAFTNIGSQSTKEELPQGIIADGNGNHLMFQIESNHSWYYEIADFYGVYYLGLGTANLHLCNWAKKLGVGETYKTVNVALAFGNSLNSVVGEMTKYRRTVIPNHEIDTALPVIFNEYMWFAWNSPSEEKTKRMASLAAAAGAEYYVIDCGWHDECAPGLLYPNCGVWKESNVRYPSGLKNIAEYIHSFGMKIGLWLEPEVVGIQCQEMLDYYGDECFLRRFGKKIATATRYFLDYRHPKVREYMTETIRRMVEYGAEYIKFDYNQDMGVGADNDALTFGEGLESASNAYLSWVEEITAQFPSVIFENCASGGARLDYQSLSKFPLCSTSDCSNYLTYPYLASNLLSAVLPEQSGVWSYPVGGLKNKEEISDERVVINMVNALLGRMHLASDLSLLNDKQLALVREGVDCFHALTPIKKSALPFLPLGFAKFGDEKVAAGLIKDNDIYLCVWNLSNDTKTIVSLGKEIKSAEIVYPKTSDDKVSFINDELTVRFSVSPCAIFLRVTI